MDKNNNHPISVMAAEAPARKKPSIYPEPFASMMAGREKRPLGDLFGIKHFGVNLTRLAPGAQSALLHRHAVQEEFIFILEGNPSLVTEHDEIELQPGECAGFTPDGVAHQLVNRTSSDVVYLEIGDRREGDQVSYPSDDLVAVSDSNGQWRFSHKNGDPY
jgi:uncharacterized cupin superfamily protein